MVEYLTYNEKVKGSTPLLSKKTKIFTFCVFVLLLLKNQNINVLVDF